MATKIFKLILLLFSFWLIWYSISEYFIYTKGAIMKLRAVVLGLATLCASTATFAGMVLLHLTLSF